MKESPKVRKKDGGGVSAISKKDKIKIKNPLDLILMLSFFVSHKKLIYMLDNYNVRTTDLPSRAVYQSLLSLGLEPEGKGNASHLKLGGKTKTHTHE